MECLTTIATTVGGLIFPQAWTNLVQEYGFLTSYKRNVENLELEVKKLKEEEQRIVGDARRDHKKFRVWLQKVKDIEKQINEDNEGDGQVRCLNMWPFLNVCLRLKLSKEAERMTQTVSGIINEGRSLIASPQMTTSPFARDYEAMESRTSTLNEIKQALKKPDIYMIGVYGMGGAGKSMLVEELAWQVEKEGSFGVVVMVTSITNTPDFRRIQGQLAHGLRLKLEEETEEARAGELRERISEEKSILVILDDIWDELDLTKLGVLYGNDHKGCKLVLTSRDCNVLNKMKTQENFPLEVLSEGESWDLFEKTAGDVVKQHDIKPIAVQVAKCCASLPLSIVTVAKSLRKKNDVRAWRNSLNKLKQLDRKGSLMEQVSCRLKFSYDCLESEELKSLFLLIGCFEQDAVNTEKLLPICWGLGLYEVDTLAEARDRHYTLIDELRASSLLLERETKRVRMHDLVHDVARKIAPETHPTFAVKTIIKQWPEIYQLKKCHYISLPCDIAELPEKMDCSELELLSLENSGSNDLIFLNNFFSGMREVKVLHLRGMKFIGPPLQSLRHLAKLRSLKLSGIEVEDIAIVGELTSLEILIVKRTWNIVELPKEIANLTQLRMLKFSRCRNLRLIPKNLLSSLKCLEELYLTGCPIKWEAEGRNNHNNMASLGELRKLDQLTALGFRVEDDSICPSDMHIFENLERYKIQVGGNFYNPPGFSRTLVLSDPSDTNFVFNDWVRLLLKTVESLHLGELGSVRNIFPELNGDGFMELRYLNISGSIKLLHIIDSSSERHDLNHAFPRLETLFLYGLTNMEEICRGPLPAQSFDMLRKIGVQHCNKLKHLLLCSQIRHLSQLREMSISRCECMTGIIAEEIDETEVVVLPELRSLSLTLLPKLLSFCLVPLTDDTGHVPPAFFDEKVSMPSLETVSLAGINTCKIWDDNLPTYSCIQNLTSLVFSHCDHLTSLFPSSVSRALAKLKYLEIDSCTNLKKIFVHEDISSEEVILPILETLRLSKLGNLKTLWPIQLAPNSYSKLNEMDISRCPKLLNVFPSYVLNNLQNLERLNVRECVELEVIFEIQEHSTVATNQQGLAICLRTLHMRQLPKLKYIWSKDPHGILRFQSLREVSVHDSGSLNHVFPISLAEGLQQLQELHIQDSGIENVVEKISECDKIKHVYLEKLTLTRCHKLKNIVPSSVVFQNLHELFVLGSHEVVNIMAPSAATNLSKLRVLNISGCRNMEEIVASDHDDGNATSEIAFMKLEELELSNLLRLTSFCRGTRYSFKFPSLKTVSVYNCPMMETFCAKFTSPSLYAVHTPCPSPKNDEKRWDGNLNTTVANIFTNKVFIEMRSDSEPEEECYSEPEEEECYSEPEEECYSEPEEEECYSEPEEECCSEPLKKYCSESEEERIWHLRRRSI